MKKIKLISSLSALGVLAASTPIIASSCSNNKKEDEKKDTTVSYLEIDQEKSTREVGVSYDEDGSSELGHVYAKAYNKSGEELQDKNIHYIIDLSSKPTWVDTISIDSGVIKVKPSSTQTDYDEWLTTWSADCEGVKSSTSYPIKFVFIPTLNQNGIISLDDTGNYVITKLPETMGQENINELVTTYDSDLVTFTKSDSTKVTISATKIKYVQIVAASGVTTIPGRFCAFTGLTYIDLEGLASQAITTIGGNFLSGAINLVDGYLDVFPNVTTIGDYFLNGLTQLRTLDVEPIFHVTSIGSYFLKGCNNLTEIKNLNKLTNLKSVGQYFLSNMDSLEQIDFSGFTSLDEIGDYFVCNNKKITSISLDGLTKLESVPSSFLSNNSSLKTVNLNGLTKLKSTYNKSSFLVSCKSLEEIIWNTPTVLEYANRTMFEWSDSLKTVDISGWTNSSIKIASGFMYDHKNLQQVKTGSIAATSFEIGSGATSCFTFATGDQNAPCYKNGITIIGTNKTAICQRLPDVAHIIYRKLR